jgi:hypothetical protein
MVRSMPNSDERFTHRLAKPGKRRSRRIAGRLGEAGSPVTTGWLPARGRPPQAAARRAGLESRRGSPHGVSDSRLVVRAQPRCSAGVGGLSAPPADVATADPSVGPSVRVAAQLHGSRPSCRRIDMVNIGGCWADGGQVNAEHFVRIVPAVPRSAGRALGHAAPRCMSAA